jgi:glycosyltransferase involved in cell wall biosynthesis
MIVAETDPPLLCLVAAVLRWWHRARLVAYLQDIYPDIAVALGKIPDCLPVRWLRRLMFAVYRRADRVVVLSRDMKQLLVDSGVPTDRVVCIPNWIDTNLVIPQREPNAFRIRHDLDGQFVVMYSGNLGLCQRLEDVPKAARQLLDRPDILFLLVGAGALKPRLETLARQWHLCNVRFLPYQPKEELSESLSAADLHLVPLDPRVTSCLMPSKLYGVLASGSPLLAVAREDCELAELTRRKGAGLVVPPGEPDALADAIRWSADHRDELQDMGIAARKLAEQEYDRTLAVAKFAALLADVHAGELQAPIEPDEAASHRPSSEPAWPTPATPVKVR